jgi:hypothetical protein
MQVLHIQSRKGEDGKEEIVSLRVVRSWTEKQTTIHLFANGTYGYQDGKPVQDAEVLKVIKNPRQYNAALAWWKSRGEKLAAEVYSQDAGITPADAREYSLYYQYTDKRTKDTPPPSSWREYSFPYMPDWWGIARVIELDGVIYERAAEAEPQNNEEKPKKVKAEDF